MAKTVMHDWLWLNFKMFYFLQILTIFILSANDWKNNDTDLVGLFLSVQDYLVGWCACSYGQHYLPINQCFCLCSCQ